MKRKVLFGLMGVVCCVLMAGCAALFEASPPQQTDQTQDVKPVFDSGKFASELARQVQIANESPAFRGSEVLDGMLSEGVKCGVPQEFADRVRAVVAVKPYRDLTDAETGAIKGVR